jgi:alpha-L-rhamnosidase
MPRLCRFVLLAAFLYISFSSSAVSVTRLRCEYLDNPLGIDTTQPRLSWNMESNERGELQSAYQVFVATDKSLLGEGKADLWDSGRVDSEQSINVLYSGKPLQSGERCFWSVRVWDKDNHPTSFSKRAMWQMGLLNSNDWHGKWIAQTTDFNSKSAPFFRHGFEVTQPVKRATVYVCGLGYYELHLNGKKVGDHLLDPGYTRYDKRDLYVTYDVTDNIRRGANAIGAILGNGWFNVQTRAVWEFDKAPWRAAPKLLLELRIELADGTTQIVATDNDWHTNPGVGPITFNSIYGGENYDARLELPGWDTPEYNCSAWPPAIVVDGPKGKLVAQTMPPIKATETFEPKSITEPKPGVYVIDFGQNMAGFVQLSVSGKAGTEIKMKYGERLTNGMLDQTIIAFHVHRMDSNQQFQTDSYILNGKGKETWHSRFTYHGFQYIEVTGFPGKPTAKNFKAYFIHSAVPEVGTFECSNELFNKIWRAGRYSYLSNLEGIPTDCPHREKNGWTGDAHLACEQGLFNYDSLPVYEKWLNDLNDEQRPTGELPGIVPTSGWGYKWGNGPAWDSAFVLIPYYLYEYCGDTRAFADHYDGMKRYVDYLMSRAKNGIINFGLPDWAPANTKTPTDITSTAYYFRDAQIVALAAKVLGKETDAQHYTRLASEIKSAFNKHFFKSDSAEYGNGSQTSLNCALYQGLVESDARDRVTSNLVANVHQHGDHIDTGILGAKYVLNALSENGQANLAYQIANQKTQPSWGWWIDQGATTLWEQWNGDDSRNHIMYGDILAWFYKTIAGINPDPQSPGFKHFIIKPHVLGNMHSARAKYNSAHGLIVSDWYLENRQFNLSVTVPPNTTATIYLPVNNVKQITEGGRALQQAVGVRSATNKGSSTAVEVGSGTYKFTTLVREP